MAVLHFEALQFWSQDWRARRIYSPVSYRAVRNAQLVPIAPGEAIHQAHWYPVVWLKTEAGAELVSLRSLLAEGGNGDFHGESLQSLSHLLFAYPFTAAENPANNGQVETALDAVLCDRPTDAGSPILDRRGQFTKGTSLRLERLSRFQVEAAFRAELTEALLADESLEPWPLAFDLEGAKLVVENLMVVRPKLFESGWAADLIARFGTRAGTLLAAHRLSLYRVNWLRIAAKRELAVKASESAGNAP